MKSTIALAGLIAASALSASSSAGMTFYSDYTLWLGQVNGASGIAGAGGAAYSSDWSTPYQPVDNSGTINYGGGWQTMSAVSSGPALSVSGTNIDVGNGAGMQQVQFTFLANGFSAPHAPVSPNGMYAWGFYYSGFNGTALTFVVNGDNANNLYNFTGLSPSGFVGVVSDYMGGTGERLDYVTVWVGNGQGFSITSNEFASVPAPGALALLGVAVTTARGRRRA